MEELEQNNQIKVTVSVHTMTEEEMKQEKLERKQQKIEDRKRRKENRKKAKELRSNFKTMSSCMIYPQNIKIASLEKCIYSKVLPQFSMEDFAGVVSFGYVSEEYEPIEGEKVLIQLSDDCDVYFDMDEVNNIFDLYHLRKQINNDLSITLDGKILDCYRGSKIRINRESLRAHPKFEYQNKPISLKQLKKELAK